MKKVWERFHKSIGEITAVQFMTIHNGYDSSNWKGSFSGWLDRILIWKSSINQKKYSNMSTPEGLPTWDKYYGILQTVQIKFCLALYYC